MIDIQEWKDVVGFEKYYSISFNGIIKSKEYEEIVNNIKVHRKEKFSKPHETSDG